MFFFLFFTKDVGCYLNAKFWSDVTLASLPDEINSVFTFIAACMLLMEADAVTGCITTCSWKLLGIYLQQVQQCVCVLRCGFFFLVAHRQQVQPCVLSWGCFSLVGKRPEGTIMCSWMRMLILFGNPNKYNHVFLDADVDTEWQPQQVKSCILGCGCWYGLATPTSTIMCSWIRMLILIGNPNKYNHVFFDAIANTG